MAQAATETTEIVLEAFERFEFSKALEQIWGLIGAADKFIVERAPWKLAKAGDAASAKMLDDTLYTAAETLRIVTGLLSTVLPDSAEKIWAQLGFTTSLEDFRTAELHWGRLPAGQVVSA